MQSVYNPGAGVIWTPSPDNDPWKATGTRTSVLEPKFLTISVDVGFMADATVISVIDTHERTTENFKPERFAPKKIGSDTVQHFTLLAQHSLKLGAQTPDLLRQVAAILNALPYRPVPPAVVWDATGLGAPLIQMARAAGIKPSVGITITSGSNADIRGQDWRISKSQLVSALHQAMVYDRLSVAQFQGREELANELAAFSATTTKSGNPVFEAAAGAHDDRVMSLAQGIYFCANRPPPVRIQSLVTGESRVLK